MGKLRHAAKSEVVWAQQPLTQPPAGRVGFRSQDSPSGCGSAANPLCDPGGGGDPVRASRSQSEHRLEEAEVTVRVLSAQPCLAQRRAEMLCSLTVVHALLLPRNHLERRKEGKKGRNPCSWEAEKLSGEMEDIHRNQTPGCTALLAGDRRTHYPLPSCLVQGQLAERRHLKITAQNRPWGQSPADGVCVSEGSLRAGAP